MVNLLISCPNVIDISCSDEADAAEASTLPETSNKEIVLK
jgi:hypothetical protein